MTTTNLFNHAARRADQPPAGLLACDVMTSDVATVVTTTTVREAMTMMRNLGIRHLAVLGDGRFLGLVDDRLVTHALLSAAEGGNVLEQPVSAAMTQYVPQVAPSVPLQRVATLLRTSRCDAIVVIDAEEHLLGVITMVDVVTAVALGHATPPPKPSWVDAPPPVAVMTSNRVAATGARS